MKKLIALLFLAVPMFAQEQALNCDQKSSIQIAQKDQQIAEQLVTINQYEQALAKANGDIASLRSILMKQNKDAADKIVQDAISKAKEQVMKDKKWPDAEIDDKNWTVKEKSKKADK